MGATAALRVVLVDNPIHIDCDRNSHTAFVLIVMHKMHTCIYKTGAYRCWIFKRDIIIYEYLLIRPGQIKKIFQNFLAMA